MTADVGKGPNAAVALPDHQKRSPDQLGGQKIAGLPELVDMRHDVRKASHHGAFLLRELGIVEYRKRHAENVFRVIGGVVVHVGDEPPREPDLLVALHRPRLTHETMFV